MKKLLAAVSRKSTNKNNRKENLTVAQISPQSGKNMGRAIKAETAKIGVKRTRGRPRVKEFKSQPSAKRKKRSSSYVNQQKRPRHRSSSPTLQEPPELEAMSAAEDDDASVSLALASLISIDDHLRPGKCILICPLANCRKRFSNPIELVSHLRVYHISESCPSLNIYACPLCLPKHSSSHSTSSDLNLLSEHAVRYHGKTYTQNDFIYFCTIIVSGDKSHHSPDNIVKKETISSLIQSQSECQYHPIFPLVPDLAISDVCTGHLIDTISTITTTAAPPVPTLQPPSRVTRVTTDSLGLHSSYSSFAPTTTTHPPPHIIQISPVTPRAHLPQAPLSSSTSSASPRPVLAALAAAAAAASNHTPTLLLSSPNDPHNIIASLGGCNTVGTGGGQLPVLISSVSRHQEVLTTPTPLASINAANVVATAPTAAASVCLSPNSADAIAQLHQMFQSAAAANRVTASVTPPPSHHHRRLQTTTSTTPHSKKTSLVPPLPPSHPHQHHLSQFQQQSHLRTVTVPQPLVGNPASSSSSSSTPLVAGVPGTTYSFIHQQSPTSRHSNFDLDNTTTPSQSTYTSSSSTEANADLLTLARLSVTHATADLHQQQTHHHHPQQQQQLQHQVVVTSEPQRKRRLLPRNPTLFSTTSSLSPSAASAVPSPAAPSTRRRPTTVILSPRGSPQLEAASPRKQDRRFPAAGGGRQEEAPLMTAALVNAHNTRGAPSQTVATITTTPAAATTASSPAVIAAKCRLLQASSYVNVQPRQHPSAATATAPPPPTPSLVPRVVPSIRPATFQKILPRPLNSVVSAASTPYTIPTAGTATSSLIGLAPKDPSHVVISPPPTLMTTTVAKPTIVASPTVGTTSTSHVNGNSTTTNSNNNGTRNNAAAAAGTEEQNKTALAACKSPSTVNIST